MQILLFPAFVGLGIALGALAHLALGPGYAIQAFFLIAICLVAAVVWQAGGAD